MQKDVDCMERLPVKDKCEVELLLEYRFENTLFHSLAFDPDLKMLVLGSSKG